MNKSTTILTSLLGFTIIAWSANIWAQDEEVTFETIAITPTITVLAGQGGNVAVSAGKDGVFIIDDKLKSVSVELLAAVREISDMPIRYVINTHYHGDHMGSNEIFFENGATIIAHDNVRTRLETDQYNRLFDRTTPAWPDEALPVVTFDNQMTVHINGDSVFLRHVPSGHTDGDSIVYFRESNVIHMGDDFFNGNYPYIDLDGGGSIQGILSAADLALSFADEDTQIIPGHGPVTDAEGLRAYRQLLTSARNNVQDLIDEGKTLEETIAAKPTAQWDETHGKGFVSASRLIMFIYNSLMDMDHFTPVD